MSIYDEYPNLKLQLSDFMPLEDDRYKREVVLKWDSLRSNLGAARQQLA